MKRRIDAHVVMEKLVPRITEEYRKIYDIPENHESMAIFSADCEDVMWLAVDDATKKAKIKVIQIETVYGGVDYSWSRYGGEITAIISGEKVADVKSGLQYAKDYIENKSGNYSLNEEGTLGYYVDYVPRIGKYYQESLGLSEGTSIAYLVSASVESMYGLDKALKAADVKIANYPRFLPVLIQVARLYMERNRHAALPLRRSQRVWSIVRFIQWILSD